MYTELDQVTEQEYNKDFKKVDVKYWVITNTATRAVIKKVEIGKCNGVKIAAIQKIEESKLKQAHDFWNQ